MENSPAFVLCIKYSIYYTSTYYFLLQHRIDIYMFLFALQTASFTKNQAFIKKCAQKEHFTVSVLARIKFLQRFLIGILIFHFSIF